MATNDAVYTLGTLAEHVSGELVGDAGAVIRRVVSAGTSDSEGLTFASTTEFAAVADSVPIGGIVIGPGVEPPRSSHIVVENARASFGRILELFVDLPNLDEGVSTLAHIHPTAKIDGTARVGPFACVGKDSSVGPGARVYPYASVGERCRLGSQSVLHPHASLIQDVVIGDRCIIHAGARIGSDGFGFEIAATGIVKVPQVGGVLIGNDVEVGANSCIDRGAIDQTIIGDSVKIDNMCQIGHNARIGARTVIAGTSGIGGSAVIGEDVLVGAAVGISDHVVVCSGARIGARSGVLSNINAPGDYFGSPAQRKMEGIRAMRLQMRLPELWNRIRKLEASVFGEPES